MIMRHWMDCPIYTDGRLREWRIFTRRQGDHASADTGAVCYDINCFGRAVVLAGVTTEPACRQEEVVSMCVASGEGILLLEGSEHPIRAGSSFTIPPGREHYFSNTGATELEFIFGRRPPASSDGDFQLFHWTDDRPRQQWGTTFQGHWNHIYRGPSAEVHIADLTPHKFSHPHNHNAILDEIWYVHRGEGWHWMGQEYRPHTPGYALWLDPTALHSLMNPGQCNIEYIYCASWALVQDRLKSEMPEEEIPSSPAKIAAALEQRFGDLVQAYRDTGVSIHDVDRNILQVEKLIQALKT